jgi:exodeoxyribonuclease V alpha subunit
VPWARDRHAGVKDAAAAKWTVLRKEGGIAHRRPLPGRARTPMTAPNPDATPPPGTQPAGADRPLRELRGVVERITFQSAATGFTVARLAPERAAETAAAQGEDRLVTLVGTLPDLTPGEAIVAQGSWQQSPTHGWQFRVADYRTTLDGGGQGMQTYLGSGLVKGIGPINAGRIVATFGDATFTVIDAAPRRLREVPGIGPVRATRIAAAWAEQRHIREVMAALQSLGVSTSLAVRIYQRFGDDATRVVRQEPFRLAREVWGIGFKTADTIAQAVGIARDAPARVQAGVLQTLGTAAEAGHTLVPEAELTRDAATLLGVAPTHVPEALAALRRSGDVLLAMQPATAARLLALAPFGRAESGLASRLRGLAAVGEAATVAARFARVRWAQAFAWLATRHGVRLAPEQEAAVQMALTQPLAILTGGPGTGKTHTLRAVLLLAQARRLRCLVAAPTGRAAKRMEEATGLPALTLHRLLELRPGGLAGRNPDNPLPADLVVVDEVSMLDVLLANQLVKALAPGTHLLLVGDPDQLPSVGAGNVLADVLAAACFPVTRLTHIFRQGAGSGIAATAQRVNAGERPQFGRELRDCFWLPAATPEEAAALVVELVARRIPARGRYRPSDIQVLVPMHRGAAGVGALNTALQERLNPARAGLPEVRAGGRVYRAGDRVLQLRNDYELGLFNGDLATIQHVDRDEQEVLLRLDDGREVAYPTASLHALTHAYAISVHKAQGAEFPVVVLLLVTSHAPLLSRTLLYTALTRARELVLLVGQQRALGMAVQNWRTVARHTALGGLLTATLRFDWSRGSAGDQPREDTLDERLWEGLLATGAAAVASAAAG